MAKRLGLGAGAGITGGILKDGYKHFTGVQQAILKNADACVELANLIRSSYGPNGMKKLIINHLDKKFVTSDCATILSEMEVQHPAAKLMCMASKMQEQEKGDGTNFVVMFCGALLQTARDLLRIGVPVPDIVKGFVESKEFLLKELPTLACYKVEDLYDVKQMSKGIQPVLAARHYGSEEFLADLVAEACITTLPPQSKVTADPAKKVDLNTDSIRIVPLVGGMLEDSQVLKGFAIPQDALSVVKSVENCKIAVFGCAVAMAETETKGTVLINSADDLMSYAKGEEELMEAQIKAIAESGAKVIVSGGSVSEMALHYIDKFGLLCIKLTSKWQLRRLCRAVGATASVALGAITPDEMGYCDSVKVHEFGGRKVIIFRQNTGDNCRLATILLRSSTVGHLQDVCRSVDAGVKAAKAIIRDQRFVAGAGASEMELATRLAAVGEKTKGLQQYSIKKFAEALEISTKILSENCGLKASDVISRLYAAHSAGNSNAGVNVEALKVEDAVMDTAQAGIIDHLDSKINAFQLAIEVAITVLRVDCIIMSKPAGGPKGGR
eukprot:g2269.t1